MFIEKNTKIKQVIVTAGENFNGIIFSLKSLKDVVQKSSGTIKNRLMFGEFNYPRDPTCTYFKNVSHMITDLFLDGNNLICEIETLNTPKGKILEEIIERNEEEIALKMQGKLISPVADLPKINQFYLHSVYVIIKDKNVH